MNTTSEPDTHTDTENDDDTNTSNRSHRGNTANTSNTEPTTETTTGTNTDYKHSQQQQRDDQWQLDIPDPTTLHQGSDNDHTSDAKNCDAGPEHHPHKDVAYYACPFCDYTDLTERVVRTHITRADDSAHQNHNAFVDQIYVQAMADDDTIVEDVDAPGATRYTGADSDSNADSDENSDEVTFLPDGVDPETESRTAEILDAAIKAPMASPADLAEEVYGDRTQTGHLTNMIGQYLMTSPATNIKPDTKNESRNERRSNIDADTDSRITATGFDDLTEKQQRVILARLDDLDPERSLASIAEAASVSASYPRPVLEDHEATIDELRTLLDAGTDGEDEGEEDKGEDLTIEALAAHVDLDQPEALTLTSIGRPDESDNADAGTEDSTKDATDDSIEDETLDEQRALAAFAAATGKQQAVVLAWLVDPDPDRSMASVNQLAGVSQGYTGRVLEQYEETVTRLGVMIEDGILTPSELSERADIDHEADLSVRGGETHAAATDDGTEPRGRSTGGRDGGSTGPRDASTHAQESDVTGELSEIESRDGDRAIVGELATAMAVLEDAARADVAVAPPDSPMHVAAQRQLYVIDLVQDCLDRLEMEVAVESAVADTFGTGLADERPADTPC